METLLEAKETNPNARLQLTTSREGIIWFDQVSAMPLDTYKATSLPFYFLLLICLFKMCNKPQNFSYYTLNSFDLGGQRKYILNADAYAISRHFRI